MISPATVGVASAGRDIVNDILCDTLAPDFVLPVLVDTPSEAAVEAVSLGLVVLVEVWDASVAGDGAVVVVPGVVGAFAAGVFVVVTGFPVSGLEIGVFEVGVSVGAGGAGVFVVEVSVAGAGAGGSPDGLGRSVGVVESGGAD